ncbi:MAG TPA: PadR family transcriptional regulator [Chloroflexota bacterium]|nr:PadR family transcriptional regulator [Chloroflexota bacterium]
MTSRTERRSPLAMVVLALLAEAPMHAYRMQQLIKEREKDKVVNVAQRNSIYQTIDRLRRAGLIAVRETARDERRPERTVYEITPYGSETLEQWLREMLSTPAREFPEFPAALAFLPLLDPCDVRQRLERRVTLLEEELAQLDAELAGAGGSLPRIFLVEVEYARAVTAAELAWVRALVDDLRSGRLTWLKVPPSSPQPPSPPEGGEGG